MANAYTQILESITGMGEEDFMKELQKFNISKSAAGWGLTDKARTGGKNDLFAEFMKSLLAKKAEVGLAEAQSKEQVAGQERGIAANKESQLTSQSFQKQMTELSQAFQQKQFEQEWANKINMYEREKKDRENAQSDALWQNILGMGANLLTGGIAGAMTDGLSFGKGLILGTGGVGNIVGQRMAPKDPFQEMLLNILNPKTTLKKPVAGTY